MLTIVPSMEKVGIRPLAELWCLWLALRLVVDRRRLVEMATSGALALLLITGLRFAATLFVYLEHDGILVGSEGFAALALFSSPTCGAVTLVASGLVLEVIGRRLAPGPADEPPRPLSRRGIALSSVASAGLGLLIGFAGTFEPPGREKAGRVLFDDRFCGVWEPTARQLDTRWYGDFSTYSFSSLAEWLGHWFLVDVNTRWPYTDELLARYDVLILKTPVRPIPEAEREAIDRFVTSGGGLLLVGDHTNLLGMGTHLNSLCARHGLRFRYDSVSDATTGGFVNCFGPALGRHVAALRVDHLQFMTSCSLELGPRAEPIVTAVSCRRDPHDSASPSFFGRPGPHPDLAHGPAVLAATVGAGRGRIAAFTDSTVWSSFAIFQYDREKLATDLIGLLNREPSPLRRPLRVTALAALALGLLTGIDRIRTGAALPVLLGGLLGVWGGVYGSERMHRMLYALGPPCPRSARLHSSGREAAAPFLRSSAVPAHYPSIGRSIRCSSRSSALGSSPGSPTRMTATSSLRPPARWS